MMPAAAATAFLKVIEPRGRRSAGRVPGCVHEGMSRYEDEGSARESRGAVSLPGGAWWAAALSVPMGDRVGDDAPLLLRIERHGLAGGAARGDAAVELLLSGAEVDAIVALVAGVVAQARRDGVLGRVPGIGEG